MQCYIGIFVHIHSSIWDIDGSKQPKISHTSQEKRKEESKVKQEEVS